MKFNADYFENIFIYKCLTDQSYVSSVIDYTDIRYFNNKDIRLVWDIIKGFYDKHSTIPNTTEIKQYIQTNDQKQSLVNVLTKIKEVEKNLNNDELYQNTELFLKERSVYNTMLDVAQDISSKTVDPAEILEKFDRSCNISLHTDIGLDLYNDIDKVCAHLSSVEETIPTSWNWLDENIGGGIFKNGRALYVFVGQTNIGKSIFLGNVATNIAKQGKTVLLITLEMPEMLYAKRICSNVAKIPLSTIHLETHTLKKEINSIKDKGRLLIKEFPPSTITPRQLYGFIKKITDRGIKIDAIVLDYINLLSSPIGSNSYERVKYITEQVRAMSYSFSCPVISASQLNRSGTHVNNPDLTTISESLGLSMTADVMVSIFQSDEDRELGIIRLGMMKNRLGPVGSTQAMRIDYGTLTVTEAEDIEEDESTEQEMISTLEMFKGVD
jgi:replicative DNA helicase